MTFKEKMERREYLMEGNLPAGEKRRGLRVIIVTENFLPKVKEQTPSSDMTAGETGGGDKGSYWLMAWRVVSCL